MRKKSDQQNSNDSSHYFTDENELDYNVTLPSGYKKKTDLPSASNVPDQVATSLPGFSYEQNPLLKGEETITDLTESDSYTIEFKDDEKNSNQTPQSSTASNLADEEEDITLLSALKAYIKAGIGLISSGIISAWKWVPAKVITWISVLLEICYQYFLQQAGMSLVNGKDNFYDALGQEDPNLLVEILRVVLAAGPLFWITLYTVIHNAGIDVTAIEPQNDVFDLLSDSLTFPQRMALAHVPDSHPMLKSIPLDQEEKRLLKKLEILNNEFNWLQKKSHFFYKIHRGSIILGNYMILATADLVAVADWSNYDKRAVILSLIGIIIVGTAYYELLTGHKLRDTAVLFWPRVFSLGELARLSSSHLPADEQPGLCAAFCSDSMFLQAVNPLNWPKTIEAGFEITCTSGYRAIAAGAIGHQLINIMSKISTGQEFDDVQTLSIMLSFPIVITFETTLLSRTLPCIKNAFTPLPRDNNTGKVIMAPEGYRFPYLKTGVNIVANILISRTGPVVYLLNSAGASLITIGVSATLIFFHGAGMSIFVNYRDSLLAAQKEQRALLDKHKSFDITKTKEKISKALYALIANGKAEKSPCCCSLSLTTVASYFNGVARIARQLGYIAFCHSLMEIFFPTTPALIRFMFAHLTGVPVGINDYNFYLPGVVSAWKHYLALHTINQYGKEFGFGGEENRRYVALLPDSHLNKISGCSPWWARFFAPQVDFDPADLLEVALHHNYLKAKSDLHGKTYYVLPSDDDDENLLLHKGNKI